MDTREVLENMLNSYSEPGDAERFVGLCEDIIDVPGIISKRLFWDNRKKTLLRAVVMYFIETRAGHISLDMIADMLRQLPVSRDGEFKDPLREHFRHYADMHPESPAVREYMIFDSRALKIRYAAMTCLSSVFDELINESSQEEDLFCYEK